MLLVQLVQDGDMHRRLSQPAVNGSVYLRTVDRLMYGDPDKHMIAGEGQARNT